MIKINQFTEWLQAALGFSTEIQGKLLISIVTIFVLLLLRRLVMRIALQRVEDMVALY